MKKVRYPVLLILSFLMTLNLSAQSLWNVIDKSKIPIEGSRYIQPTESRTYTLKESELKTVLQDVPLQNTKEASSKSRFLEMPLPDGTMANFKIVDSPVMAKRLGDKYPDIKTYSGIDINNPANFVRFDLTQNGFHAMMFTEKFGTVFIDPYSFGQKGHYVVYEKKNFRSSIDKVFECGVIGKAVDESNFRSANTAYGDCTMRTYRIAIAATGEYTAFHGGTQADALAAQVTTMNRVNMIYMRDMAIFMEIVPNNDLIVYTDAASDPYTNGNPNAMIGQVVTDCNNKIGLANYDIGHVFGTDSGGLAGLGVVCFASKAEGVTGSGAPIGDPFDVDYVAHEIGHQFGCNHTFNNSCEGNRNNSTAYEPGSGSTIMAYAGICAPNVQSNSDDHFHAISLEEMSDHILSTSCPVVTPLTNNAPIINSVTTGHTIPGGTPFALTAEVTDVDGDPVSYCWEQMDREISTQAPVATSTNGPNFRSNSPTIDPTRYFPNLPDVIAGNSPTWEVLATVSREYNFRVSVRDNSAAGGCSSYDAAVINVDGNSGPFLVISPDTGTESWDVGSTQTVSWDVAGTDASPVNCSTVDILLSTDGGLTYPTVLVSNVSNTGTANVIAPNLPSTTARVKIVCSDNVFYDISNNDFTIVVTSPDYILSATPVSITSCDSNGETYTIDVESVLGYIDPVNLLVAGLPSGVTATLAPTTVTPGGSSTLTLSGTSVPGSYSFTIQGTSTTGPKGLTLGIEIEPAAPIASSLISPLDGAIDLSGFITFDWSDASGNNVTYDIEVADDPAFNNLINSATNLTNSEVDLGNFSMNTTYYWRVRASNSCGVGQFSTGFSFSFGNCMSVQSTDVPVTISQNGTPSITSTLTYAGTGAITDINVFDLIGTHSWINDLSISLTSPAGTTVVLFSNICDDENNFNVNFDDSVSSGVLPCPPNDGGTYQPAGSLSDFNGENPNGIWTLTISDAVDQDGGALTNWSLEICETSTVPDCLADIIISDSHSTGMILDEASNSITSTEMISGNADVEYSAGTEINLNVGFSVDMGAILHAYILGCTP